MSATRLIANLGGEERPVREAASPPAVETAAALWRLLFARASRGDGWPDALGPAPEDAAFPWLEAPGAAVAWLVNDDARAVAEAEGLRLAGPSPEVVRRVHDKGFAIEAARAEGLEPGCLRGVPRVLAPEDLAEPARAREHIAAACAEWPTWLRAGEGAARAVLKPRFGTSGRGRVAFTDPAALEASALARLAERGGAILEPWLERVEDFSVQLHLGPDGLLLLGTLAPCVSDAGVPRGVRGTLDRRGRVTSGSPRDEALREAAVAIGARAREAGYSGPCGLDAFVFRGPEGVELRPVVELNARFTLGSVAVGLARRVRARAVAWADLDANERLHFHLELRARGPGEKASGERVDRDGVLELDLGGGSAAVLRLAREAERLA